MHQPDDALQRLLSAGEQVLLEEATVVEGVDGERGADPLQRLLPTAQLAQDGGTQGASLVVVRVADEGTVHFVESILPARFGCTDAGRLEVTGIGPRLVPRRLPEPPIGLRRLALVFQGEGQVEERFAVVGVRVALLPDADGGAQVVLRLVEASAAQVPEARLVQAAHVQRVAVQSLLVVVEGRPCGVAVLLQVQARQVELVHRLALQRRQGSLGGVGDGADVVGLGVPRHLADADCEFPKFATPDVYRLAEHRLGREGLYLVVVHGAVVGLHHNAHLLFRGGQHLEADLCANLLHVHNEVARGLLHDAQFAVGHEVLRELLLLVGHQPREVGLVLGVDARHQFDVGAEAGADASDGKTVGSSGLVGQVAVPGPTEVAVAPGPLLLAGREVVAGHVQHAGLGVVLVTALEVVLRVDGHITGGHLDVAVVGDVHAGRVVHLVVCARGDGETADGALAVVEDGVHVGREDALVLVVHLHGGIGPPEERLGQRGAVAEASLYLQIGTTGAQREAHEALLVEHALHLVAPHGDRAVLALLDGAVHGQVGGRAVVLRPVELDAAANPRTRQTDECGLDDVVVVDEVALADLVVGHLYAAAQFGHHHHFDVLILQVDDVPVVGRRFVGYRLDDGIGIHHAARALIDTFLQEYRVFLRLPDFVGRDAHSFSPGFYC